MEKLTNALVTPTPGFDLWSRAGCNADVVYRGSSEAKNIWGPSIHPAPTQSPPKVISLMHPVSVAPAG